MWMHVYIIIMQKQKYTEQLANNLKGVSGLLWDAVQCRDRIFHRKVENY